MLPRILVFGSSGQVAGELRRAFAARDLAASFLGRAQADLSRPETLGRIVSAAGPDVIIIAAAYTDVDRAETETALAMTVNAEAPRAIGEAAARISASVVHFSSDYVFDGAKAGAYIETDVLDPLNAYGLSKRGGEDAVRAANPRHLILRTSWVYSARGRNFLKTMLRLAESKTQVSVVDDQHGCPTAAGDLAVAVARLVPALAEADFSFGTYHLAGEVATTWHGFAEAIFRELARRGLRCPANQPIATEDYPTPARRPLNSRLASDLFARTFGFRLAGYDTAMPAVVGEALAEQSG